MSDRTLFIGIDPGQKGAIASIDLLNGMQEIKVKDIPLFPDNSLDFRSIREYLDSLVHRGKEYYHETNDIICILEKAQTMPKQGIKGAFNYGRGYQVLIDSLTCCDIPFMEVRPAKWKKHFSLGSGKKQAVMAAIHLYPDIVYYGPKGGIKDGRAEAVLIAEYGRQITT